MKERAEIISHFIKFKFDSASSQNYLQELDSQQNVLRSRLQEGSHASQKSIFSSSLMLGLALIYPGGRADELKTKSLQMI